METNKSREKWGSKVEFVLSLIGLSVGLGNVWRYFKIFFYLISIATNIIPI